MVSDNPFLHGVDQKIKRLWMSQAQLCSLESQPKCQFMIEGGHTGWCLGCKGQMQREASPNRGANAAIQALIPIATHQLGVTSWALSVNPTCKHAWTFSKDNVRVKENNDSSPLPLSFACIYVTMLKKKKKSWSHRRPFVSLLSTSLPIFIAGPHPLRTLVNVEYLRRTSSF